MRSLWQWVAVLVLSSVSVWAQVPSHQPTGIEPTKPAGPNPHTGSQNIHTGKPSSRVQFAQECGLSGADVATARTLSRSAKGEWRVIKTKEEPGAEDTALARVWHEKNWMVDMHESGGSGDWMHVGFMCFRQDGSVSKVLDRYINMPKCNCMRTTETAYDAQGKVAKQSQSYSKGASGGDTSAPANAKELPVPFEYKTVEQLPFYGAMKRK